MPERQRVKPAQPSTLRAAFAASRGLIVTAAIFGMGLNVLYLAPSLYMLQVYDRVLTTGGLMTLALVSVILLVALIVLAWLDAERSRLMVRISLRLDRLIAPALIESSAQPEGLRADAERMNLLREFDTLRQAITGPVATAAMDAPWAPVFILVCAVIHPFLALAVTGGAAILLVVALIAERRQRDRLAELSKIAPLIYVSQEADAAVAATARVMGMRQMLLHRALVRRRRVSALQVSAAFTATRFTSTTKFLRLSLQSLILGLGAWLAIERQISPGAMIAASILSTRALSPLEQIIASWRLIRQSMTSYQRIENVLQAQPAAGDRTALPTPRGKLRFEAVSVQLPGAPTPALSDVSFELTPGEMLGVVGPSGAGKSTLARTALGMHTPASGAVRIDDANIVDWDVDMLGRHVGYVPQEVHLIAGTVGENIRRFAERTEANAAALDAATVAAARLVGAHDMILRLPKAYETPLGLGGAGLSAGQAQRIALARAFFGDPAILVLDEPNAHLDTESEAALTKALQAARGRGAAVMLIAHRATAFDYVDRVLVLSDGKVRAIGPREQILARPRPAVVHPAPAPRAEEA